MTDTTQQPAVQAEAPRKRLNMLEALTSARGMFVAAAAFLSSAASFYTGQAVNIDITAAELQGQAHGQDRAAQVVEAALERAMPKAMAPITAELAAVKAQVGILTVRVWAVENGVPLPADATAVELPVIHPAQRHHRVKRVR